MTDHEKIKQAVRLFLEGIGEDVSREGLRETPERIARMCEELYGGMDQDASDHLAKTFDVESSGMVIEKDITFTPPASIISFHSTGRRISPISRTGKWWA